MKKRPGLAHFKKKNYSQIKAIGGEWWCKNKYLKKLTKYHTTHFKTNDCGLSYQNILAI